MIKIGATARGYCSGYPDEHARSAALVCGRLAARARELTAGLRRLARLPARPLAAREVIEEHVHLAALLDGLDRIAPEPARDDVGHDAEALPELVHEAEGELAVPHGGADEE